jgi:hypothetical protein
MLQVEQCALRSRMEMTGARDPSPAPVREGLGAVGWDAARIGFAGRVMGIAGFRRDAI